MQITLPTGHKVLIDVKDIGLTTYKWCQVNEYAGRWITKSNGRRGALLMHRVIMQARPGELVDHINGNKKDNRRCNLRIVTKSQNAMNIHTKKNMKGITYDKRKLTKPWLAQIMKNGHNYFLGRYAKAKEAASAYNKAAIKMYGTYARLNMGV